ncbi:hypothetical protein RUM44_009085 [Polyplax serrata]|uniref:Uncharacterized protein n=1 Tax=Polyplax serrata TaxID=468196 RepID=A0ABR1ARN7_POLSC
MIIQFTEERGPDILTWITVSAATTWTETSILRTWHQTACQSLASIVFLESSRSGGNPKKSFDIFVIVRRRQMFLEFSTATIVAHLGEQLKYVRNIDCLSGFYGCTLKDQNYLKDYMVLLSFNGLNKVEFSQCV